MDCVRGFVGQGKKTASPQHSSGLPERSAFFISQSHKFVDEIVGRRVISAKEWARLSKRWKNDLERRIRHLTALRDRLGDCIGCGCLSLDTCPMRNPMDVLGEEGAGPRLLQLGK